MSAPIPRKSLSSVPDAPAAFPGRTCLSGTSVLSTAQATTLLRRRRRLRLPLLLLPLLLPQPRRPKHLLRQSKRCHHPPPRHRWALQPSHHRLHRTKTKKKALKASDPSPLRPRRPLHGPIPSGKTSFLTLPNTIRTTAAATASRATISTKTNTTNTTSTTRLST